MRAREAFLLFLSLWCMCGANYNHDKYRKNCHPASCAVNGDCYCSDERSGWYNGGSGFGVFRTLRKDDEPICYKGGVGDCECEDCGSGDTQCQEERCDDSTETPTGVKSGDKACFRIDPEKGKVYSKKQWRFNCYRTKNQCTQCPFGEKIVGCMRTSSGGCVSCGSLRAGYYWTTRGSCDMSLCGAVDPGYYMTSPCDNVTNVGKLHCSVHIGNPLAAAFPNPIAQYYCPGGVQPPVHVPSFGTVNALYTDFNCQVGYFKQGAECRACLPGSACLHDKSYTCKANYYTDKYAQAYCKRCTASCTYDSELPMRCQEGSTQTSRCVTCGMCGAWPANGVNCVRDQVEFSKFPETCTPLDAASAVTTLIVMYAPVDTTLPFVTGLVVFCIIARLIDAILYLCSPSAYGGKQVASTQFVISLFDFVSNAVSSIIYTTLSILSGLLGGLMWATILVALGSIFYLLYEEFPWVWTDLARSYNAFLGPFIQNTIVEVLKLSNVVFRGIIPLWNGVVFFFMRLLSGYTLPTFIQEIPLFQALGGALFDLVKHFVVSLFNFLQPLLSSCPEINGDLCFDAANRTLDLMTPMADVRQTVTHLVVLSKNICGFVGPVVDAASFPFMDINFASAVHNLANGVLYLFVSVSKVTYLRCTRHGGEEPLMCTPDLEPVFVFLAAGTRSLGFFLNNWLNVIYVIVQGVLGWSQISCSGDLIPSTVDPGPIRAAVFNSNRTVLVGLTGGLVAVTDGSVVAYEGKGHLRLASWPSSVNISHGVAAVTYGRSSDADVSRLSSSSSGTSTSLFGCTCVHGADSGMQIQCSILPYGGLLASETGRVPVFFQQGSAVQASLGCADIDIVVQSVRWPATRFSSPSGGGAYTGTGSVDCVTSKSCNKVDASIWIIPRTSCDSESAVCDCFPYCMAARLAGSQTAPVVFYSASQWKSKVFLIERDCNLHAVSSNFVGKVSGAVASAGVTSVQASVSGGLQFVGGSQETISCVDNLLVTTLVNRSLHPAYDTPTPAFLRNPMAPFVITGDTVLTSVQHGDGGYTVRVERLTGAAGHEFTLSVVSNNFPAAPPPSVPSALFTQYPKDHLTIPYSRLETVAVSSRDYVFYAVNPATEVFEAYLHYCRNNGNRIYQFGLIMASSYSPIRVWRVDAYRRCGVQGCGTDLVKQVDIPNAFSDGTLQGTELNYDCTQSFNDAITQLEYIDEVNIAITVRRTDVKASFVNYTTYWLHAHTMQLRDSTQGPWTDSIPVTALNAYSLCPAMQILPEFGSIGAEVVLAGVFLLKMPIDTVLYLPGIISMWSKGVICPLQSRGHTVLQQCGVNAFSLEDFFSSLQTASNLFWSSLTFLSAAVGNMGSAGFVENGLNGLARYGAGTIDLWTVRFQVLNLMKAGPASVLQAMPTTVISGASGVSQWAQGPLKVSSNALGWARFGYASVAKVVVTLSQNVAMNKPVDSSTAWRIVVNTLDEMHDYYDSFVVDNMRQACAGLSLMLGISNPWAVFVYQQCIAANTVVESGLSVVLSVFNLAPFAQCMCSGSSGRVFGDHARIYCVPQASTTLRPVLIEMIQSTDKLSFSATAAQALCSTMLSYTRSHLVASMQPWFDAQDKSLDALAASVDYVLFWIDPKAGDCLDFEHDPDVVVLMPYPMDYFQACGSTSICRSRCSGVFEAFDASLAAAQAPVSQSLVTVAAESLFFPVLSIDAFTPMRIYAIVHPSVGTCLLVCGKVGDNCVAVAGVASGVVVVQYYCVPLLATSSVFRTIDTSLEWTIEGSTDWSNDILQLQFGDSDGRYLVSLVSTGNLYLSSYTETVLLTSLEMQTNDLMVPVLQIPSMMSLFLEPYICISINVLFRLVNGQITGSLLHRKVIISTLDFPNVALERWRDLGESQFFVELQGYAASHILSTSFDSVEGAQFLLLPKFEGMAVGLWTLTWDSQDVTNGLVGWSFETLPTPSGVGDLLSSGQTLSQNCFVDSEGAFIAFAAAPDYQSTAWLSQLRVSGASASAYKSQQIPVQVETLFKCDISSCLGCPDGETQRLCDAAQQCAVMKCIGTPVNMRRVLCQVGQVIADDARQSLALLHGTWVIFVDMFMTLMDLSLQKGLTGVTLTWPDDRFFGYICTIKDNNAHMISVLTSALNGVIQMGHSAVMFLQGGAHEIDSNFNALVTMPLTALTNLANQVALAPLYPMIVLQQIMMCRANGVLAIFDVTGYTVRVGDATMQDASARLVGQCLTQNFVAKNKNPADAANSGSTARIVSQVIQSSATALLPQLTFMGLTLETLMHAIDGKITYWMGVVYGLSDLLQSLDMAHCKLPDYFLNDTMFCACGDSQYVIPEVRRREGLSGVGLWCTGTLTMLDASNQPFVVYNPFSYAELQSLAVGTDAYLACMSGKSYGGAESSQDCHSLLPSTPELSTQGVSVLTVLTACRNNYMHKQWDRGAHILFNQTLFTQTVSSRVGYPGLPDNNHILVTVGKCLADQATRSACLQDFLVVLGQAPETYWTYEDAPPGPSQTVDACEVFTGPANNSALTAAQRSVFRACLDHFSDSNCQLSSSLWTPQSDNAVPVAQRHGVRLTGADSIQSIVQLKFDEAYALVMSALKPLKDYNNNDVLTIFFSPEGDIMHQMMDCVFMGPYSRVDYWPVDSHRILSVPVWHRDSNGSSRQLDPRKCVTGGSDKAPPYSCGSQARQAVIKYFFRDYLPRQKNATLKSIISGLVSDLTLAWNDTHGYACLCPGGVNNSVTCCKTNSSSEGIGAWLPPGLTTVYQTVPANHILRALTTQLEDFYRFSLEEPAVWTKYMDSDTLESYNWTKVSRAAVAVDEALFRSDTPIVQYDESEVNSPLLSTGLWHQCHGVLSQLFFTIPMQNTSSGQWIPRDSPTGPLTGADGLATFIQSAVRAAHAHSPIYRHYNVSYVPSDSRMCRRGKSVNSSHVSTPGRRKVSVSSFSVSGSVLMNTSSWKGLPVFGVDSFLLDSCFCGWDGNGTACRPPAVVCETLPSLCPTFDGASRSALELIKAHWSAEWPCPALAIGDHSGIMGVGETDVWLSGVDRDYSVDGQDILRRGRSGLRVGNFESIGNLTGRYVSPSHRVIEPMDVVLPYCASDYARMSGMPLLDTSVFKAFVARLFPVGQGVFESGTTAYCLRYLVELGMLEAMSVVYESQNLTWSEPNRIYLALSEQRKSADVWRVRCESQISLLTLCKNLDVFQPPIVREHRVFPCPFSVAFRDTNDIYTTPGCLVHSGGFFYDPCNCPIFACASSKPMFSIFNETCRIPFDPRNMTVDTPLGEWRVSPMRALHPDFVGDVMRYSDSLGNVPRGMSWHSSEGFMNTTGLHCDMLTDWWPERETLPVGYHATSPCGSEETGYRSFDSAFAVERGTTGQFTVVRMVYQHDLTRDASKIDTHLGAGGVCRLSNLGMPFYQTNTMQICTRQLVDDGTLDPAIPIQNTGGAPDWAYGPESCSSDSADMPWYALQARQDSALHSVGTVPNMPNPDADTTYPPANTYFGVGPKTQIQTDLDADGTGWGVGCSDYGIKECSTSSDCPQDYHCLTHAKVCMSDDFLSFRQCYRHDMCPEGFMCSGVGQCVQGYIVVLNALNDTMEAPVFSEQCDEATSYSYATDGSSPWEYVPDWLIGHGMCSNKNWYMYMVNYLSLQAKGVCSSSTTCDVDARSTALGGNGTLWWPDASSEPQLLAVKPTLCDRDYEHLKGPNGISMKGCAPKNTLLENRITDAFEDISAIKYAGLFRNFNDKKTSLKQMPFVNLNKTGFLGYAQAVLTSGGSSTNILNCERYQNCYAYPFTLNGVEKTPRLIRKSTSSPGTPYVDDDIFRCGVSAYYDASQTICKLDALVHPLYTSLCKTPSVLQICSCSTPINDGIGCKPVVNAQKVQSICGNILEEFPAGYAAIQSNTKYLQELFNVFIQSDGSLASQISGVECFEAIYSNMQSSNVYGQTAVAGVYYPFSFALYEIPFAWVYQCVRLGGINIDVSSAHIRCQQFEQGKTLDKAELYPEGLTSFHFSVVKGGYRRADVVKSIAGFKEYFLSAWPMLSSIPEFTSECAKLGRSACDMVPYCASTQEWVPNSKMDMNVRSFLAAMYQDVCSSTTKNYILQTLGVNFAEFLDKYTRLLDYSIQKDRAGNTALWGVEDIIKRAISGCASLTYDETFRWPVSFVFDTALSDCVDFVTVLTELTMHLVRQNYMYSNTDQAYMPNQNIASMEITSIVTPPGKSKPPSACIFTDLDDQIHYYDPNAPVRKCTFVNRRCATTECKEYPLVFATGEQGCRYPMQNNYTSLSSLVQYVWLQMKGRFNDTLSTLPAFVPASPVSLPFFEDSNTYFPAWSYDITGVQRYMSNINPDTSKELMCVLSSAKEAVNFTTCNDKNFEALSSFAEAFRTQGAAKVPPANQLRWKVSQPFFERGGVFAFANATRDDTRVLLKNLFNQDTRCGVNENMFNRVCLVQITGAAGTSVKPWVPWMSGEWNPYEFCDVRLLELNQGNQEVIWPYDLTACPECSDPVGKYRKNFMLDTQSPSCDSRQLSYARLVNVDPGAPTNLCYIRMHDPDQTCTHAQGMAGGERGQSILNHPTMPHLYGALNNTGRQQHSAGIFPRSPSTLLSGRVAAEGQYGFLSVPGDELGVTAFGLKIATTDDEDPYLRVSHLPLQPETGFMEHWKTQKIESGWVQNLDSVFNSEDRLHAFEQQARGSTAWDCPMRRAAFYSQSVGTSFVPALPNPGRSRRIFNNLTQGRSAHPTFVMNRDGSALGFYTTSNGFCFCPGNMSSDQTQCLIPLTNLVHNCSLKRTIDALKGLWVQSQTIPPSTASGGDSTCRMQFDWPYVDGKLRDGTTYDGSYAYSSDPIKRRCHVVDRLKPFLYRYKPAQQVDRDPGSTVDSGGVCHTGRGTTLTRAATAKLSTTRCVKQSESDVSIEVSCEDGTTLTLSKERSTPLDGMVEEVAKSRRRCDTCAAPPSFTDSKRQPIAAESSFGIPFRFSASRATALDLRQMVCGGDIAGCDQILNHSAWTSANFMQTLLTSPRSLFNGGGTSQQAQSPATGLQDPAWDKDWVFCNSSDDLKASTCSGRIPERNWRANRFQSCYKTVRELTRDSPDTMSSVDVCLTDSSLQALCLAVQQAQTLVRQANCLASGSSDCILKPFVYLPSAWDVSNQAFVHQTVRRFYSRVTSYACPLTVDTVRANNQAVGNRCAAKPVGAMYLGLQACRDIVDALAQVVFYMANILINGFMLMFAQDKSILKAQIVYYWSSMVAVIQDLLSMLSDIFFDMLFHMGAMGQRIYNLLKSACGIANKAYQYWLEVWCGLLIDLAPMLLGALRQLSEYSEVASEVLNDALGVIFRFMAPEALSAIQGMGYTKHFRDKRAADMAREKQVVHNSMQQSKKEGKSFDKAADGIKKSRMSKIFSGNNGFYKKALQGALLGTGLSALAGAGVTGAALSFMIDIGSGIFQATELKRMYDLYPDNWTLFDFQSVYTALDTFEYFISTNDKCLAYRASGVSEIFNCTFPTLASKDSLAGAMLVATRCWADAQRDVGTSNLLACTESDTCYRSLYDTTSIVCAACPDAGDGYSLYGCSPVTKMCTCSVPTTKPSSCTTNEQCQYATTTCLLITGLDFMSYGNQPCFECTKQVQCLIRDDSGVGQCGCVFQVQPIQQCTHPPGQRVEITAPNKVCGYLPNADRTHSVAVTHWDSIALTQCLYLNPSSVYCVQVFQDSGVVSMAVGLTMASMTSTYQSRRLLSEGRVMPDGMFEIHRAESEYALPNTPAMHVLLMEDWNNTAAPCSDLVWAYQQNARSPGKPTMTHLGPLDTMALHRCAYWRQVGRETIRLFRLSSLSKADGFLLSTDDFAAALAQKSVIVELVQNPEAIMFALGHLPVMKPVYASLLTLRSLAVSLSLSMNSTRWHNLPVHDMWHRAWHNIRAVDDEVDVELLERWAEEEILENTGEDLGDGVGQPISEPPTHTGRRLLQTGTIQFAENWLTGPFTWPPTYYTQLLQQECNIGTAIVQIMYNILEVLIKFYYNSYPPPPTPPKTLWGNLPDLTPAPTGTLHGTGVYEGWISQTYHFVWSFLGINTAYIRSFFSNTEGQTNVFTVSTSMLQCDFTAVTYCTHRKKDLVMSAVLFVMLYVIVALIARMVGLPILATLMFWISIPLLLWYCYGMALTCGPMLPTCLIDDVIQALNSLFPREVTVPQELSVVDDCLNKPEYRKCFKSCGERPILFNGWRDTLAFGVCYLDVPMCRRLADVIGARDSLGSILLIKADAVETAGDSLLGAMRLCFMVTSVDLIPVIALLTLVIVSSVYVLYLPCVVIPRFFTLALQSLAYTHAGDEV